MGVYVTSLDHWILTSKFESQTSKFESWQVKFGELIGSTVCDVSCAATLAGRIKLERGRCQVLTQ